MEAAWVPKESRKMLLGCVDCVASQVHGYLKAHQTEHSTCTRPHMIILQQGHVMLKGERGEREGESRGGSTSRVDTLRRSRPLSHRVLVSPKAGSPWQSRGAVFSANIIGQNCVTCLS